MFRSHIRPLFATIRRQQSTGGKSFDRTQHCTIVDRESGAVICWHPPQPIAYEATQPIDLARLNKPSVDSSHSKSPIAAELTAEHRRTHAVRTAQAQAAMRSGPSDEHLQNMFHTYKFEWLPQSVFNHLRSFASLNFRHKKRRIDRTIPAPPKYRDGI